MRIGYKVALPVTALLLVGTAAWALLRPMSNSISNTDSQSATTVTVETNNSSSVSQGNQAGSRLIIGNPNAGLTIIEYSDFQCPICRRYFNDAYPRIVQEYIDTGKIKIEFRVETHIGAESQQAGEAAYCANEQNKFKAYHDELFKRASGVNSGAFSYDNLKRIASDIGLDATKFNQCLDVKTYQEVVQASHEESKSRITGTPTFFIGERKIVGAQPFEAFRAVIESEL